MAWHADHAQLALWNPETMCCIVHVPGHWVALTRPEGAQTVDSAALLCDSLRAQPVRLSVEEIGEFFAQIGVWQQHASLQQAGEWSVYVVTHAAGEVVHPEARG